MRLSIAKISLLVALLMISGRVYVLKAEAVEMPVTPATLAAADVDTDGDGLSDARETSIYFTDATKKDTDDDGFDDGHELKNGFSPRHAKLHLLNVDSDQDGMNDGWELSFGTDIMNPDTDGDGLKDGAEVMKSTDPRDARPAKLEKIIRVDVAKHRLTYFLGDRPLESFAISAGTAAMPTPVGEFVIQKKIPVVRYKGVGYDYPNTKWNMLFTRVNGYGYYVHGAYWHDNWGRGMSHGCVNVKYDRMERLYVWADVGTKVITSKGN
jgi:hypothetical protein